MRNTFWDEEWALGTGRTPSPTRIDDPPFYAHVGQVQKRKNSGDDTKRRHNVKKQF